MVIFFLLALLIIASIAACYFVQDKRVQFFVSLFAAAAHLVFSLSLFTGIYRPEMSFLSMDALSRLFLLVVSNVYFWIVFVSYRYLNVSHAPDSGKKYYFLFLNFYLLANSAAILSNNFAFYWVMSEATTLSVAPLIYYYRSEESLEAMWKYLFVVSVGIAFVFIGIIFLALSATGTGMEGKQLYFADFIKNAGFLNPVWLKACFIFIFVGISVKIGIAPMHSADVDATSNSPGPIAGLMSGSLRVTALIGLLRIFQIVRFSTVFEFARFILIIGGLLSLLTAFVYMFRVKNYKRMLAYSSVEHLGIIVLGVATGGAAFIGAMYHVMYNSLNKVVLFLSAGSVRQKYKTRDSDDVSSVLDVMPWTGWIFLFSFLAVSAVPPFGMFFSELRIFQGMLFSGRPWVLAATMFFMLFIFINMARIIMRMLYRKDDRLQLPEAGERFNVIHAACLVLLSLLVVLALFTPNVARETILDIAKNFGVTA
jgi:hydrogenase-4 component F